MLVEFGKSSLLSKARAQPERVRQVLDKISTEGLLPTMEAVFSRLGEPMPMGYCNAGVVVAVGADVTEFDVGDRVASNGPHAEYVCVPKNLCVKVPDEVSDVEASFTVLGSIALQGVRLLSPTVGERFAVIGLGLVGLLTVQLLSSSGCRVLGLDLDPSRLETARRFGAETVEPGVGADPVSAARALADGQGLDGVIIAASTKSHEPIRQAARMCRKRGRIVVVGAVGMELNRSDFYKKELTLQVSCSYGPGRYDPVYEEKGRDYPMPYVRWTVQRNFSAIVELLRRRRLDVAPLVTITRPLEEAPLAYRELTDRKDALGIVLTYPAETRMEATVNLPRPERRSPPSGDVVVGVIGAGIFTRATLLPALKKLPVRLRTIACAGGVSGFHAGRRFGFERATTDHREIIEDSSINLVIITTRHNLHASMTIEALGAGKHVAVEKPLCLNEDELAAIQRAYNAAGDRQLLVGFNRRFSPHALRMKELLAGRAQPLCMSMMVNAGVVADESWVHDPAVGGGRIIGEACHWIDLMVFLTGSRVVRVGAVSVGESPGLSIREDKASVTLQFADGSIGAIHYFGNGARSYPKETMQVFCEGKVLHLDNFRSLTGYGWPGFGRMRRLRLDKGHREEFRRLIEAVERGGPPVVPFDEIENVMLATFAAADAMHRGSPLDVPRQGALTLSARLEAIPSPAATP